MRFRAWTRGVIPAVVVAAVVLIVFAAAGQAAAVRKCDPETDGLVPCRRDPALRRAPTATPTPAPAPAPVAVHSLAVSAGSGVVPFTYAYVFTGPVPLYADPAAIAAGDAASSLAPGYVWVRITGSTVVNEQRYYRIKTGSYLPASVVAFLRPSSFAGIPNPTEFPFAWVLVGTKLSASAGAQPTQDAPSVSRYQTVRIYEEQKVGDGLWYRVGENQWIEQRRLGVARLSSRPQEIPPGQKWIEVNLFEQTLMAYEGDRMVYATLISSGLPYWSTIEGVFRAWAKVRYGDMYGAEGQADYYYLEDVPWTIYFYNDYAIHAAYWHDRFGYPHSHGCVNVPPASARWLFEWADPPLPEGQNALYTKGDNPGIWVWVHE